MKTYLVVGLGATGISIIEFLYKDPQNKLVVFDTRANLEISELQKKFPDLRLALGEMDLSILSDIDEVIVSPSVPLTIPVITAAQKQNIPVIGDIELFYRHARAPIIGITGTNAKSTVTTLVTEMINATGAQAEIGGNIGIHALTLLDKPVPDYYVLELSSFQLELTVSLSCLVAVVLNVSPNHLDRHTDMLQYQSVKERLYLNSQHPIYFRGMQYLQKTTLNGFTFGIDAPATSHDFGVIEKQQERYLAQGEKPLLNVLQLGPGLQGEHNVLNALSALAITAPLKLELLPQIEILKNFRGLPHRSVLVCTLNGVRWINDSKGTTISATIAGVKGLARDMKGEMILILGGQGKGQDFNVLRPIVNEYVAHTLIFGEDKAVIAAALHGLSYELASDLDEVIAKAHARAREGDIVLFSPACASFDMFKNFEARGDLFAEKVNAL